MESPNTMDRMLCLFQACRDAVEYEKKLSHWLGSIVKLEVEYDVNNTATAKILVDELVVCELNADDPVIALDELMCWVWGTMVIGEYTNTVNETIEA